MASPDQEITFNVNSQQNDTCSPTIDNDDLSGNESDTSYMYDAQPTQNSESDTRRVRLRSDNLDVRSRSLQDNSVPDTRVDNRTSNNYNQQPRNDSDQYTRRHKGRGDHENQPPVFAHTIKPDTYEGSQCFEQYLSHFVDCAELSRWDPRTMVLVLSSSLRGAARTYYMSLPECERRDYYTLSTRLRERFGSSKHQSMWLNKLENRRRTRGESIASLGDDLRQLAQKAYYDLDCVAQERLALNQLYKLVSIDMKCRCIDHDCSTVNDAVAIIEKYESILGAPNLPQIRSLETTACSDNQVDNELRNTMRRIEARLDKIETAYGPQPRPAHDRNAKVCFRCHSPQHFYRNCPLNTSQYVPQQQQRSSNGHSMPNTIHVNRNQNAYHRDQTFNNTGNSNAHSGQFTSTNNCSISGNC